MTTYELTSAIERHESAIRGVKVMLLFPVAFKSKLRTDLALLEASLAELTQQLKAA